MGSALCGACFVWRNHIIEASIYCRFLNNDRPAQDGTPWKLLKTLMDETIQGV